MNIQIFKDILSYISKTVQVGNEKKETTPEEM